MLNFYLLLSLFLLPFSQKQANHHPIFVTVTTIEENSKEHLLEVSCKLFTDDFEKTLRGTYKTHVDLLNKEQAQATDKLISDFIPKHLQITVDGKKQFLKYVGFEPDDDGTICYFEIDNISKPKKFLVFNDLLYNVSDQQMGLVHIIVNGKRQSTKISFPDKQGSINF